MNKEMQKIYLHDRWFYYVNETNDLLIYNSLPNDLNNGIRMEYNKKTKDIKLLYFQEGKVFGKLNIISDNNMYNINYKNLECELIENKEDTYANLLYEMKMEIDAVKLQEIYINLTKKRNLNKMCYLEPTFPLNQDINIRRLELKNSQINYLENLFGELRYYLPIIYKQIETNLNTKEQEKNQTIKELMIPDLLNIYDRKYTFVEQDEYNLIYENISRGVTTLKIELDPYEERIKNAAIEFIPKDKEEVRDKIEFSHDISSNIIIKYINFNKLKLELNRESCEGRIETYAEYNDDGETIRDEIYLNSANKKYKFFKHPVFRGKYISEDGTEYTISNSEFAKFHGFQNFICPIVHNMEKQLYKELNSL